MDEGILEREAALAILDPQIHELSTLYRECHLKLGRGALIVYGELLESGYRPSILDYNSCRQCLDQLGELKNKRKLAEMIRENDPESEGVMVLVNLTVIWLITVNLKPCTPQSTIPSA